MIPINLGGRGTQIGRGGQFPGWQTPGINPNAPMPNPRGDMSAPVDPRREARAYGMAEALSQPIDVGSGSWAEALAEGLAGGLRGRASSRMYQAELERAAAESEREQQSQGVQDELRRAQIEALQAETAQAGIPEWAPIPQDQLPQGARFGQENRRTGQRDLDWAPQPRADAAGRAPPAGYRFTPDGNLEAIPGGPADVRATAEGRARIGQMDSSARSLQNALSAIDDAERLVSGTSTGFMGQITRGVGGTSAYNLNQALEPVRAILSFETLAEMRRNSATGGALGSIAVRELELLGNTMRSLDTAQSEPQVRAALRTTRSQLERTLRAIEAARNEMQGGPGAAQSGATANGERIIDLEPE